MVEILRVSQEAAIQVSGRGEEPLSPTTQETIMTMQFERYTINASVYQVNPVSTDIVGPVRLEL